MVKAQTLNIRRGARSTAVHRREGRTQFAETFVLSQAVQKRIAFEVLEEGAHPKLLTQQAGEGGFANAYYAFDYNVGHVSLYRLLARKSSVSGSSVICAVMRRPLFACQD